MKQEIKLLEFGNDKTGFIGILNKTVELDVNLMGEGVVWRTQYRGNDFKFKVKGDKHSASKVKTLAKVDTEKLNSIVEFVDYTATENRFNQAMEIVFKDNVIDIKKLGDVIRWVVKDIMVEEKDTLEDNGLTPKEVNSHISNKVRNMFFDVYNKF